MHELKVKNKSNSIDVPFYMSTSLDRSYFFEIAVYNISLYQPNTLSLGNRSILGLIVFPGKDDIVL
jgi:hypothetical protein